LKTTSISWYIVDLNWLQNPMKMESSGAPWQPLEPPWQPLGAPLVALRPSRWDLTCDLPATYSQLTCNLLAAYLTLVRKGHPFL
jgi:hypothetical protein